MAKIIKPSIKIVLLKHKPLAKGKHQGEYPVALRVTFNRRSKYYVLKATQGTSEREQTTISSPLRKWNPEMGRFNKNRELNTYLEEYENKAIKVLRELEETDFTFDVFSIKYFKSHKRVKVSSFIDRLIAKLIEEDRLGTAKSYKDTRNRLNEFRPGITFQDISLKFLEGFEAKLKSRGNSQTSIGIYLRTLRAICNKAIVADHVPKDSYPFDRFKIKPGSGTKRALSKSDMLEFFKYKAEQGSRKWHSLNYFVFSYLCRGLNFKDMTLLEWDGNIIGDKLMYERAKTANTKTNPDLTIIKIEQEIAEILGHYSGNEPYVFPILEPGLAESTKRHRINSHLKKINKDIREIAQEVGLPQADQITFYWARHTYATTLKRSGVPTAVISEALGHSSEATTKAYLDKFEQPEIDKTFRHLL